MQAMNYSQALIFATFLFVIIFSESFVSKVNLPTLATRQHSFSLLAVNVDTIEKSGKEQTAPVYDPDFVPPPVADDDLVDAFCRATNELFKRAVIPPIRDYVQMRAASPFPPSEILKKLTSPPEYPGIPRGVTLTIIGSVPTALVWYGYYKFSVEEELFQDELRRSGRATGCGGYGTLLPFVFLVLAGGFFSLVPGLKDSGNTLIEAGSIWILAGQVNLYRRVNELYAEKFGEENIPLHPWWALLPPPLDVVVGLRQVHFLAKYWSEVRGESLGKDYVAEELFPFISSPRFTLEEFVREPRRWFWFTKDAKNLF